MAKLNKNIQLYDTTLRDGTQGIAVSFSAFDKIRIAKRLDDFGMHYIEGGWPGSNPKDEEFFQEAKKLKWKNAKITAFGSTRRANILAKDDTQIKKLISANTPVITIFGKSWDLHVHKVLKIPLEENLQMINDSCTFLKKQKKEVIYDAEHFFDGYINNPDYALKTLQSAHDGGADILVLCDTNGGTMPHEITTICADIQKKIKCPIGIHTHNDCDLGVANALSALENGAVQVQGTMNGFGERVGNCNLTSIIPNLQLKYGVELVKDLSKLSTLSKFINDIANQKQNPKAPFVGSAAFAHKGGMHVNAVEKISYSYEHIEPKAVGNKQQILISELSGKSNIFMKADELGIKIDKKSPKILKILEKLKTLEKKGYEFEAAEASFEVLIRKILQNEKKLFTLKEYYVSYRKKEEGDESCEATVKIDINGEKYYTVAEGDGPVNALDSALRKALDPKYPSIKEVILKDYKVIILDGKSGSQAKTRVLITSSNGKKNWGTVAVSNNVIQASCLAIVDSIEYFLFSQ